MHIVLDAVDNLSGHGRIHEVVRTDFNSRSPCEQEFNRIRSRGNAPHTDNGNLHRLSRLPDHAQSYGLHRGAREPTRNSRKYWTALLCVDGHPQERVDH